MLDGNPEIGLQILHLISMGLPHKTLGKLQTKLNFGHDEGVSNAYYDHTITTISFTIAKIYVYMGKDLLSVSNVCNPLDKIPIFE